MKSLMVGFATGLIALLPATASAVEEAEYSVLKKDGAMELRAYAASIVAETRVEADFEDAGNRAFRKLFRYIDGDPVWARYDPPFKPWFMRRNEILLPVL